MNNFKKIGLSALAGSLVAMSVNAADLAISGAASMSFSDTKQGKADRGNGFSMGDSINFNFTGETESGLNVKVHYEFDGDVVDDYDLTLSNDLGTLVFNGSGTSGAFGAVDDVTPNAYEESWDIVAGTPTVINGYSAVNSFIYTSPSFSGATFKMSYVNANGLTTAGTAKSYTDYAIAIAPESVEGLTVGFAIADSEQVIGTTTDEQTAYVKYAYGPVTVGYQLSALDSSAANGDQDSTAWGVSYAVSDNISIAYNEHTLETESTSDKDQESSGVSASYTMGGMTLAGAMNQIDNVQGTDANDFEGYEFTLSFAF
jgi:outer membrane protein OmpU